MIPTTAGSSMITTTHAAPPSRAITEKIIFRVSWGDRAPAEKRATTAPKTDATSRAPNEESSRRRMSVLVVASSMRAVICVGAKVHGRVLGVKRRATALQTQNDPEGGIPSGSLEVLGRFKRNRM